MKGCNTSEPYLISDFSGRKKTFLPLLLKCLELVTDNEKIVDFFPENSNQKELEKVCTKAPVQVVSFPVKAVSHHNSI